MNAIVRSSDIAGSLEEIQRIGKMLAVTGYFAAKGDSPLAIAQIATQILAGREMGYGPFASVQGIHIISGKPALSANLMASAVKNSPRYDYRVREITDKVCRIEFFEFVDGKRESLGVSEFTLEQANRAGVKNLDKYARNMLFARAMSNGVRWFCPDVFSGNAVYVPEELGAEVDGEGEVIDITAHVVRPSAPVTAHIDDAPPVSPDGPEENPFHDDSIGASAEPAPRGVPVAERTLKRLHAVGSKFYGQSEWDAKRPALVESVSQGAVKSSNDLTENEARRLIAGIEAKAAQQQQPDAKLHKEAA